MEAETRIYTEKNRPRWITIRAAIHHPSTDGVFAALHWPSLSLHLGKCLSQYRADDGASSEDWDERLREQWLAISSSASSRLNSFRVHLALWCYMAENVAVHHTDVYQEVEQWYIATTFAIFSCSCMLYAFGLRCLCHPCGHCTSAQLLDRQ